MEAALLQLFTWRRTLHAGFSTQAGPGCQVSRLNQVGFR
jgi:hypothetical protein